MFTFVVLCRRVGEQVVGAGVDFVASEVVALEELVPELQLGHLLRHVLYVLELHFGIRLEYGLYVVVGYVVDEAARAVRLGAYVRHEALTNSRRLVLRSFF